MLFCHLGSSLPASKYFSLVPAAVSNFPLSLQRLLGRGAFPVFSLSQSPSSLHSQKHLPSCAFSLPKVTSPCHAPAEFCGSGCADCCVDPPISLFHLSFVLPLRCFSWGAWVAQLVEWPTSAQVMISRSVSSSPASGSVLTKLRAWSLFLPLSDPPPFMLCLSLSQK